MALKFFYRQCGHGSRKTRRGALEVLTSGVAERRVRTFFGKQMQTSVQCVDTSASHFFPPEPCRGNHPFPTRVFRTS